MPKKAKFGFGSSSGVEQAILEGKLNERDILFLDENTANPKVGWVTLNGEVVVATPDLSGVEADISQLETELAAKADASDVETLETELATKANAAEVETLKTEMGNKVDAATVQTMIKEHSSSVIEVVEF